MLQESNMSFKHTSFCEKIPNTPAHLMNFKQNTKCVSHPVVLSFMVGFQSDISPRTAVGVEHMHHSSYHSCLAHYGELLPLKKALQNLGAEMRAMNDSNVYFTTLLAQGHIYVT